MVGGIRWRVVRIQYYHRSIYAHCATGMTTAAPAGEPQVTHPARSREVPTDMDALPAAGFVQGTVRFPLNLFLTSCFDLLDPLPPPGGAFYQNASRGKVGRRPQQVVATFNKSLCFGPSRPRR